MQQRRHSTVKLPPRLPDATSQTRYLGERVIGHQIYDKVTRCTIKVDTGPGAVMDELKWRWHRLNRKHASCRVESLAPWVFRVIACRPVRTSALCALLHRAGEPRGTISRMMGAADGDTGNHVLADRVRQDLSCPRPRERREGLFGVDSRRRMSRPPMRVPIHIPANCPMSRWRVS